MGRRVGDGGVGLAEQQRALRDLLVLFLRVVVVVQAHADDLSGTRDRREQSGVVGRNRRVGGGLDGVFDPEEARVGQLLVETSSRRPASGTMSSSRRTPHCGPPTVVYRTNCIT